MTDAETMKTMIEKTRKIIENTLGTNYNGNEFFIESDEHRFFEVILKDRFYDGIKIFDLIKLLKRKYLCFLYWICPDNDGISLQFDTESPFIDRR